MDGIFNVNKPRGLTSHDVVALVRRLSSTRRVGHAGTLDPSAEGVLLICVGKATRVVQYLMDSRKTYGAEIVLGVSTDTYDAEGRIAKQAPVNVTLEQVQTVVSSFVGRIWQTPPMYSAVKLKGKPLYKLARAGIEIERQPREVEVYRTEVTDWQPPSVGVLVECGKGTYVRSIAHEIGERLGCGAHLRHLVRLASGRFALGDALPLHVLEDALRQGWWGSVIYPFDEALLDVSAAILGPDSQTAVTSGRCWTPRQQPDESLESTPAPPVPVKPTRGLCRAYSLEGEMMALLKVDVHGRIWCPDKVFV